MSLTFTPFYLNCTGTLYLSLEISFILKLKHDYIYIYIYVYVKLYVCVYIYTWRSVRLHIGMQNPQLLAAPVVVGTRKSPPTTVPYTSGEAQMGALQIGADWLCQLQVEFEQA